MQRKSFVLLVVGTVMFFLCSVASADVPDSINYQGKLTTASGGCLNETVQMTFTIYADAFGTVLEWSETQTQVEVKEGIFNVLLGSVNPLAASIFDGSAKYLGVRVESDPEMSPLKPMVTTAYAFGSHHAQEADTADYARAAPAAGIASVDGVSNPGGDVDLIQQDAITVSPNDGANTITFGETHSGRTDNPHAVTAAQTGAPVAVDGVSNAGGNVDFIAGTNMTITPNDGANTVTFSSTAGGIGGSGTTNYIPKFTASTTLGNSAIYQSGSNIGIGTASPSYPLHVSGDAHITGNVGVWGEPPNSDRGINISKAFYGSVGSKYMLAADVYIGEASGTNYLYGVRGYCRSDSWWGTQYLYGVYGHGRSTQTGGSATHHIYGVYAKGEGLTSGTQTAYGLYATASGADKNWAGYFDAGNLYVGGNVGIGDATPDEKFDVNGDAAIYGGICVDDADDCTPPADGHVKADAFEYSTAQTRYYVVAPCEFTASHPDVDNVYVREQYIENEGSSKIDFFAAIHLPGGSTITQVCVWGSDATDTWTLYKGAYNGATAGPIATGNLRSCTSLSHTVSDASKYMIKTSRDGGERVYGARIEYEVTEPLP